MAKKCKGGKKRGGTVTEIDIQPFDAQVSEAERLLQRLWDDMIRIAYDLPPDSPIPKSDQLSFKPAII